MEEDIECPFEMTNKTDLSESEIRDAVVIATKQLRVNLDRQKKNLDTIFGGSRERSLAATKLEEAIMWLGKSLGAMYQEDPYPDSMDPTNTKIAPTADTCKED